jgi:hypothetical protein
VIKRGDGFHGRLPVSSLPAINHEARPEPAAGTMTMADGRLGRFLGGSPGGVIFRLILASLLVGALMALLGIDPATLIRRVVSLVRGVFERGWDAIGEIGRWIMYGAVIVVPIWFLSRLLSSRR